MTYFSQSKNIDIAGVTGDYEDTANIVMESGSFISDQDAFSAAIGFEVANEILQEYFCPQFNRHHPATGGRQDGNPGFQGRDSGCSHCGSYCRSLSDKQSSKTRSCGLAEA